MYISLRSLLREAKEARITLAKVDVVMEKMCPEFTGDQKKRLIKKIDEIKIMADTLNAMPYTIHNASEWHTMCFMAEIKLMELRAEAISIAEKNEDLNIGQFITAIDSILI